MVGKPGYAHDQGADLSVVSAQVQAFEKAGKIAVLVLVDGHARGVLAIRNKAGEDAAAAVTAFKAMGVASVRRRDRKEQFAR